MSNESERAETSPIEIDLVELLDAATRHCPAHYERDVPLEPRCHLHDSPRNLSIRLLQSRVFQLLQETGGDAGLTLLALEVSTAGGRWKLFPDEYGFWHAARQQRGPHPKAQEHELKVAYSRLKSLFRDVRKQLLEEALATPKRVSAQDAMELLRRRFPVEQHRFMDMAQVIVDDSEQPLILCWRSHRTGEDGPLGINWPNFCAGRFAPGGVAMAACASEFGLSKAHARRQVYRKPWVKLPEK